MREATLLLIPDAARARPPQLARLRAALRAQGPLKEWRGPAPRAAEAARPGLRAAVVVDAPGAVECVERLAHALPRLPQARARFEPRHEFWAQRSYPGPGTPEALWDLPAEAGASALRREVGARLAALLAPAAAPDGLASVIVPCWNGLAYTKRCVEAVARHSDRPYELIVVDNGSTDGTGAWLKKRRDGRLRVISNKANRGFAAAMNQGFAAARGRWIVWLNNDVLVTPGWLDGLVACAKRHPGVGAVGPYTNSINGPQRADPGAYDERSLPRLAQAWALRFAGRARSAHRLAGFCLLHPRESLLAVGGLDERFGLGCYEDFDFCLRLLQAGRELLVAEDVFVHHYGHKSFQENKVRDAHIAENRRVFVDKWCHKSLAFLDQLDPELERR